MLELQQSSAVSFAQTSAAAVATPAGAEATASTSVTAVTTAAAAAPATSVVTPVASAVDSRIDGRSLRLGVARSDIGSGATPASAPRSLAAQTLTSKLLDELQSALNSTLSVNDVRRANVERLLLTL